MVTFVRGRTITTAEPTITVDAGLAAGTHRFQLQVVTADGRRSAADVVDVSVQRLVVPTPIEPVLRPTVINPTATTTTTALDSTVVATTPIRRPRGAPPAAAPAPESGATPEPPPAGPGRKTRGKRRSES